MKTDKITRFEVIDHTTEHHKTPNAISRILVKYYVSIELQLQDDNKTLKVFITDKSKNK